MASCGLFLNECHGIDLIEVLMATVRPGDAPIWDRKVSSKVIRDALRIEYGWMAKTVLVI